MAIKAAIFDMDGLLLDSERICMTAYLEAGRIVGHEVNPEVYLQCIGSNDKKTREILINGHGEDYPYEEIYKCWKKLYLKESLEKPMPLKAGVVDFLHKIQASGIPMGVATSTHSELAITKLKNAELFDYFNFVIAGDQVENGKPHPEIYQTAAEKHGVSASHCMAFEDSENGVRAALAAGINVIQVPDIVIPSKEVKAMGHRIVESLAHIEWPVEHW